MDISIVLRKLGLSKKETEVYLELLKLGTQPASVIARKLGMPPSSARFFLKNLTEKRFAIQTKKANTFLFTAELPDNTIRMLEAEKEKEMNRRNLQIDLLSKVLPEMRGMMSKYTSIPKITFYEGADAIKEMMHKKTIGKPHDTYVFSARNYVLEKYKSELTKYLTEANKKRSEKNTTYIIDSYKHKKLNKARSTEKTHFKYFKDKKFVLKTQIQIDGDHISILNAESTPIGLSIHHDAIAADFRALHQQLWKQLD